jgi:outer membrane receptor protein involved in Fe transport
MLSLVCVGLANAQTMTTVTGHITDQQGAGVLGATVTLYARERPSERLETVTDKKGDYRFERVAPGEYLIVAEGEGFARSPVRQLHIERERNATLNISLEVIGVHEGVVVTASGTAQIADEVSKTVRVVNDREIEDRDEFLIPEALRAVPGLRVRQLGGPGMPVSIISRGLRSQDTAVLVDGLRLRDAAAEHGDAASLLSNLVVTDLSRLEVLRGPGAALYGTTATGGVINVVSREGGGPPRGSLLLEGGSLDFFRGRVQVAGGAGQGDRLAYSAGLTHVNVARGIDGDDASRTTGGQWRVSFHITPKMTLSTRVYATDSFVQLNESPRPVFFNFPPTPIIKAVPLAPAEIRRLQDGTPFFQINFGDANFIPSINDPDRSGTTRFFSGAIIFTHQPNEKLGYTISYQALKTDRSNFDGPALPFFFFQTVTTRQDNDGRIHTLSGRVDLRLGRANFINAGYVFEHERFNTVSAVEGTPALNNAVDATERSHTFFLQDQLSFLDHRLQLSIAFRAQFFSLGHPQFKPPVNDPFNVPFEAPPNAYTGDSSLAYFFNRTQTKLRAHVGNGYRAPSLQERFGASFPSGFVCVPSGCGPFRPMFSASGDPRLSPERSIGFDAGIDQALFNNHLRASATYFYTQLQGIIDFSYLGDPALYPSDPGRDPFGRFFEGYHNQKGGLARGLELSVTAAPTRSLDLFASYTYTNSDERVPRVPVLFLFGLPDRGDVMRSFIIPAHQFSLVATQRIGRRAQVNFDLIASSNYITHIPDSSFFFSQIFRFDGLVKADLGASYTLPLEGTKSIRFFCKVENLFNQQYFESGFRTPGRTGVAGMTFSF